MKRILAILMVALFAASVLPLLTSGGLTNPGAIAPRDYIYIEGDAEFSGANGVTGGSGTYASPYLINNHRINSSVAHGIFIGNTTMYFKISNCHINDANGFRVGIYLYNAPNGEITNNWVNHTGTGIKLEGSDSINVTDNWVTNCTHRGIDIIGGKDHRIENNTISNNDGHGARIDLSNGVDFKNNVVVDNDDTGFDIDQSAYTVIMDNYFEDNHNGIYGYMATVQKVFRNEFQDQSNRGIQYYSYCNYVYIANNTINDSYNEGVHIESYSDYARIENNTITNSGNEAIFMSGYCDDPTILNNEIYGGTYGGINLANYCYNSIIKYNHVHDQYGKAVRLHYCGGATIHNNNATNVSEGLDIRNSQSSFVRYNDIYYVYDTGIELYNSDATIVEWNNITLPETGGITVVSSSYSCDVKNNTIKHSGGLGISIANNGRYALVENNTIINTSSDGISVTYDSREVIIQYNTLLNIGDTGIDFYNDNYDAQVYNNTITNCGMGGIDIRYYSHGARVRRNVITNCGQNGIYLYRSNNCQFSENTIMDTYLSGINVGQSCNSINIINNTIEDCEMAGVYAIGANIVLVTENEISRSTFGAWATVTPSFNFHNNTVSQIDIGVRVSSLSAPQIIDNDLLACQDVGVELLNTDTAHLLRNYMTGAGVYIEGSSPTHWDTHYMNTTNKIFTKPIFYYTGVTGITTNTTAGQVIIASSDFVLVEKHTINSYTAGVLVGFSDNITLQHNSFGFHAYDGIFVHQSQDIVMKNNTCRYNKRSGIKISFTTDSELSNNTLHHNDWYGAYVESSNDNKIKYNTIHTNGEAGIYTMRANYNRFSNNHVYRNEAYTDLTDGLVANWKMDEERWNTTPGIVKDSYGGHDADAKNWVNTVVQGYDDRCGYFDGKNDYVESTTVAEEDFDVEMSFGAWVRPGSVKRGAVLSFVTEYGERSNSIYWAADGNTPAFSYEDYQDTVMEGEVHGVGGWHHVFVTLWDTDGILYVDGKLEGFFSTNEMPYPDDILFMGASMYNGQRVDHFDGCIDDVRVYEHELWYEDVQAIFLAGKGGGMTLEDSAWNRIDNNTINENEKAGIMLLSNFVTTIENNDIDDNENYGIFSFSSGGTWAMDNEIDGQDMGMMLYQNIGDVHHRNDITADEIGIFVQQSQFIELSDNAIDASSLFIDGDLLRHWNTHFIDPSNTVNGSDVFYARDQPSLIVPQGYGTVILANCSGSRVTGHAFEGIVCAIEVGFSSDVTINTSTFSACGIGIYIHSGVDNLVKANTFSGAGGIGFEQVNTTDSRYIRNTITDHDFAFSSVFTYDNMMYNNYFDSNVNYLICGADDSYNRTKITALNIIGGNVISGNYWSDYAGIDLDGDWLGDTEVPHGPGDEAPLAYDVLPPSFQDHTGLAFTGQDIILMTEVFEERILDTVSVEYWYGAQSGTTVPMAQDTDGMFKYTISVPLNSIETLYWQYTATDAEANIGLSKTYSRVVTDDIRAEIVSITAPAEVNMGSSITISASVVDNIGLDVVKLDYVTPFGTNENVTMILNAGEFTYTITGLNEFGTLVYKIYSLDTSGNINTSLEQTLHVKDNVPPLLKLITPADQEFVRGLVNVLMNASDAHTGIDRVEVTAGGLMVYNTTPITEEFSFSWDTTESPDGLLDLVVKVYDKDQMMTSTYVSLYVDNTVPAANAGLDVSIEIGKELVLDASLSTDANAIVAYSWSFDHAGSNHTLVGKTQAFTFSEIGYVDIQLMVEDIAGNRGYDMLRVTVTDVIPKEPLSVLNFAPDGSDVEVTADIVIEFNMAVHPDWVDQNLTVSPPLIGADLIFNDQLTTITITHQPFSYETTYTVTLNRTITSANGRPFNASSASSWTFTTGEEPPEEVVEVVIDEEVEEVKVLPNEAINVSGSAEGAEPGDVVVIELDGETYYAVVQENGDWWVLVDAPVDPGTFSLNVSVGGEQVASTNVTVNEDDTFVVEREEDNPLAGIGLVVGIIVMVIIIILFAVGAYLFVTSASKQGHEKEKEEEDELPDEAEEIEEEVEEPDADDDLPEDEDVPEEDPIESGDSSDLSGSDPQEVEEPEEIAQEEELDAESQDSDSDTIADIEEVADPDEPAEAEEGEVDEPVDKPKKKGSKKGSKKGGKKGKGKKGGKKGGNKGKRKKNG